MLQKRVKTKLVNEVQYNDVGWRQIAVGWGLNMWWGWRGKKQKDNLLKEVRVWEKKVAVAEGEYIYTLPLVCLFINPWVSGLL